MPRVNRDLQRRLAARRERERRRPTSEPRYRFTTSEPGLEADGETLVEEDGQAVETVEATASTGKAAAAGSTRGGVRPSPKPYSAYKDEYAYVYGDLRRVGVVIGGLLLGLIVLYFVLPLLVH
jgi:hypothetical protein